MIRRSFDFADLPPPRPVPQHAGVVLVLAGFLACVLMAVVVVFGMQAIASLVPTIGGLEP